MMFWQGKMKHCNYKNIRGEEALLHGDNVLNNGEVGSM
jgi:hypothetical protein